jgi:hypothetical protein
VTRPNMRVQRTRLLRPAVARRSPLTRGSLGGQYTVKARRAYGVWSLVAILGACTSQSPRAGASVAADVTQEAQLVGGRWRLYSAVFSVQRSDGFPIAFEKSGAVDTNNLGNVTHWTLTTSGVLELRGQSDFILYMLQYDQATGVYFKRDFPSAGHAMLIFPVGYNFRDYRPPGGR